MEKYVLKNKTVLIIMLGLFMASCMSLNDSTRPAQPIKQWKYGTTLPSGKEFSVTIRSDSIFEETSFAGTFTGAPLRFACKPNSFQSFESDLLYTSKIKFLYEIYDLLYEYTYDSANGICPQLRIYDRDGSPVKITYVYFGDSNENEIESFKIKENTDGVYYYNIPPNTEKIEVQGENSVYAYGGCKYKSGMGDVIFYTIPEINRGYWWENEDSLYYIPIGVEIGDTANYLFLPRVNDCINCTYSQEAIFVNGWKYKGYAFPKDAKIFGLPPQIVLYPGFSRYTLSPDEIAKAEKILRDSINVCCNGEGRWYDPPINKKRLHKYLRQYVGFLNENNEVVVCVYLSLKKAVEESKADPTTDIIVLRKNGSNMWEIKINLNTGELFDMEVNGVAENWKQLNDSETNCTFALNNELAEGNGAVRQSDDGYSIEFSQDKGTRVTDPDGGFSGKYAALFEETYHAVDIDDGVFKIGEQTAMDEARAWQFAAEAPGTKPMGVVDGIHVYSAAYTISKMSTDWVAKMLKFGGVKTPSFDWIGKDGTIYPNAVYGSIIKNKPYENLDYGKNYKPDSKHLMQDFTHVDVPCVKPDDLTFNREQLLALKGNSKKPFSGCVEGEIYYSKIVEDALMHNKENNFFYEKFGSYEILSTQALALETGMQRIVLGPSILVKGQLIRGKEFGQWHFRYKRKDMDFLLMTAQYKNGKLDGTAKFYKPDGRLYQECEFEKGKLVMRIWYNIEGKIISKEYYEDENLIRTEEFERKPYFYGI